MSMEKNLRVLIANKVADLSRSIDRAQRIAAMVPAWQAEMDGLQAILDGVDQASDKDAVPVTVQISPREKPAPNESKRDG